MPARKRNFIFELGASFERLLFLNPLYNVDLREFTGRMQVRPAADSSVVVLSMTTENGLIALDYGRIALSVPASIDVDVSALTRQGQVTELSVECELPFVATGRIGVYDLEVISPAGIVTRLLYGDMVFAPNVTR